MTDDPYTMQLRLCDDVGMVSHERQHGHDGPGTGATYLETLNFLRPPGQQYMGEPFVCTGHAHLGGKHIRCTSLAHDRVAGPQSAAAVAPTAAGDVTYDRAVGGPSSVFQRMTIEALNRVAAELRGMLADAPKDDPEVASLLRDCDRIEQLASEMVHAIPASSIGTSPALRRGQPR